MQNITKTSGCRIICTELGVQCNYQGKPEKLSSMSLSTLEEKRNILKSRTRRVNNEIDKLLNTHYVLKYKENKVKEKARQKRLKELSDEDFCISIVSGIICDEIIKRKRNFDMSKKALNSGGVYTTGTLSKPRVGMGFKGYGGVCL